LCSKVALFNPVEFFFPGQSQHCCRRPFHISPYHTQVLESHQQ
jgi:hypothetical protein